MQPGLGHNVADILWARVGDDGLFESQFCFNILEALFEQPTDGPSWNVAWVVLKMQTEESLIGCLA